MNNAHSLSPEPVDVIVVGAGISGLSAASDLEQAGLSVRVLEARSRVGVRTEDGQFASGTSIELGGQWLGPTQTAALELIDKLGLETFEVYDEGRSLLFAEGKYVHGDDNTFGLGEQAGAAFSELVRLVDSTVTTIDLSSPWSSPEAERLDSMTATQWVEENCPDPTARNFAHTLLASIFAAETHEYSALHMLFYLASGGGLHRMMITIGGAQERRVLGGTHQMSERLAERLNGEVWLQSPVKRISQGEGTARHPVVVTTPGTSHHCKRVIVALPPTLANRLDYEPPLPANRDIAAGQMMPGNVIKYQIEYERPFWRGRGLSGTILSLDHHVSLVYDNCVPTSDRGILVAFVEGRHARQLSELSEQQRAEAVLSDLSAFLGAEAAEPLEILQRNWSEEPYTRGCYGGRFCTGLWTTVGQHLADPCGRIHWAGAETAQIWNGYIDGAIRSGRRAASEIVSAESISHREG